MQVLVWNLEDHDGGALLQEGKADASASTRDAPQLQARLKLQASTGCILVFRFSTPCGLACMSRVCAMRECSAGLANHPTVTTKTLPPRVD